MKKILSFILTIIALSAFGQMYDSQRLQQLGSKLQLAEYILPGYSDTCVFFATNGQPIRVEIDSCEVITHIGCQILPDTMQLHESPLVQHFIERYVLEEYLGSLTSSATKRKKDEVRFYAGTWKNLLKINWADSTLNLSLNEDDTHFRLNIQTDVKTICNFTFPKDYQLLTGKDKLELDEQLFHPCIAPSSNMRTPEINPLFVHDVPFASYEVVDGDYFFTPQLSNSLYVQKKGDNYALLHSPYLYPEQTIANTMLCGSEKAYQLILKHYRYGYNTLMDTIPLNTWINIARAEGCVPYWGVQNNDGETIEGTYVWLNNTFGYLHVLFVRFPLQTLRIPIIPIECTLHSYVRISNVASLFAEKNITYTK